MNTDSYQLADYLNAFRRRAPLALMTALPIILIAVGFAVILPDAYRSSAELAIDLEGPRNDILEPIALTNYADQYISSLEQKALSRERLSAWDDEVNILPDAPPDLDKDARIEEISANMSIDIVTTGVTLPGSGKEIELITGFVVAFESAYPEITKKIADKMAEAFLEEDRATRTARAATASEFLREQISVKSQEILDAEAKLAAFKEENACCLPDLLNLNMNIIDRTERELEAVQIELRDLEQDRIFRVSQLEEIREKVLSTSQLAELEEEYLRMVSIYGEDHPDLIKVRRQIAALTSGQPLPGDTGEITQLEAELTALLQRYSAEHPDVISLKRRIDQLRAEKQRSPSYSAADDNPQYLQLRAQVNALDTKMRSLRTRQSDLRARLSEAEAKVGRTPQVERELLALMRDLDAAREAGADLQDRLMVAQQTEAFESNQRGARLSLIRSAYVPSRPSSPPRIAIAVLGIFSALVIAGISAMLSEGADTTIRGRHDVVSLLHAQPIATIPIIQNSTSTHDRHVKILMMAGAVILLAATVILTVRIGT